MGSINTLTGLNYFAHDIYDQDHKQQIDNSICRALWTIISCELFVTIFNGGNYTEVWALPGICYSFYIFTKYLKTGKYRKMEIFFIGVTFMYVLLLRANMVSVWIAYLPVIIIVMITRRQLSSLISCVGLFTVGALALAVPYLIYAIVTSSFREFINYYWIFNLSYTSSAYSSPEISGNYQYYLIILIPLGIILVISLFKGIKDKIYRINLIFLFLSLITSFISGRPYSHNAITVLPAMILPAAFMTETFFAAKLPVLCELKGKIEQVSVVICSLGLIMFSIIHVSDCLGEYYTRTAEEQTLIDFITTNTNPDDDVLFIDFPCICYLSLDRTTENRFFYQYPISLSDDLYSDFISELKDKKSDFIIESNGQFYGNTPLFSLNDEIRGLLKEIGYETEDHGCFKVYRLKQHII